MDFNTPHALLKSYATTAYGITQATTALTVNGLAVYGIYSLASLVLPHVAAIILAGAAASGILFKSARIMRYMWDVSRNMTLMGYQPLDRAFQYKFMQHKQLFGKHGHISNGLRDGLLYSSALQSAMYLMALIPR
ncbi:MAG: hypothetical protein GC131_03050 [Alphaproteobacteria bacterium]|nr:hypothetical protein [Alphaproteobacteria bacterium]